MTLPYKPVVRIDTLCNYVKPGQTLMIGGFGGAGFPEKLRDELTNCGLSDLTLISNNADFGALASQGSIKKLYTSYPVGPTAEPVLQQIASGAIELYLTPQGTLAEQIRSGGAGLGGVLTPTGRGGEFPKTYLEELNIGDKKYFLYPALHADVALVRAEMVDRYGNCYMPGTSLNFNLIMSMAASYTIVETNNIVDVGLLQPQQIQIPSVFVDLICWTGEKYGN